MKFTMPILNASFMINSAPEWPNIKFETDTKGAHTWEWTIAWKNFTKSGKETTSDNKWDAKTVITNYGGMLTVRAHANNKNASITVKIRGTNPSSVEVTQYISTKANSAGFDKIMEHESKFKHFNTNNEPIKSFDNGYGICQLTTPKPTFEQVWNWKLNINGGLNLYAQKYSAANTYLAQEKRAYTTEQVKYEAVCRWNGGSYHEWDAEAAKWVRKPNILCDSKTGNIGWDINDPQNEGKSEEDLNKRDSGNYSKAPKAGAHWKYYGVCYADRILG